MATANLFHLLGVQPAIGRVFDADANAPRRDSHVALLSDHVWRGTFGADPGILGRDVFLNGQAFRVIGVLTPAYRPLTGSIQPALYVPVSSAIAPALDERRAPMLTLVARLVRGSSAAQALVTFMDASRALEAAYPAAN